MITRKLIRLSALSAIAGAILITVMDAAEYFLLPRGATFSAQASTDTWSIIFFFIAFSQLLLLGGLAGLYLHQAENAGRLGLFAFILAFVGSVLLVGQLWTLQILSPELARALPEFLDADPSPRVALGLYIPILLYTTGWLLFGAASLRAGVYPQWASILLVSGALIGPFIGGMLVLIPALAEALFGAGIAWMGVTLWAEGNKLEKVQAIAYS